MTGIIIQISENEFQQRLEKAVEKALANYSPLVKELKYLTRKEVAAKLRISLPTLNEYTKSGKLKGHRLNGRVLYRDDEINEALNAVEPLKYRRS